MNIFTYSLKSKSKPKTITKAKMICKLVSIRHVIISKLNKGIHGKIQFI